MPENLKDSALRYHEAPKPGKLEITATKPLSTQRDLALAYSPGVAFACEEIVADPNNAARYTARSNLVGVVTNGTAVLGLGSIGALASKPVMEGKAVLFKKFAGIDVFDIEINEHDPDKLVEIIAALEPTFGGINLEDIKAPECFEIERRLRERMNIPVFHDDQHGTAIIVGAAVYNALRLVGKKIEDVTLVSTGGGAASLACLDLLVGMGLKCENILLVDLHGVVHTGRNEDMNPYKSRYARETDLRTLDQAIEGADIFLGLSAPGVLKKEMAARMAPHPLILALANPTPEILPEEVREVRDDAIMATGRSDYPNQVNNVLCFPYIFRGALDVGATTINEEMKIACVKAIAELAMVEATETVANTYQGEELKMGPEYIIPKPFDPRLIAIVAPAVAKAAMESGVATRPIEDMEAYTQKLNRTVIRSGLLMQPVFEQARKDPRRVVYAEGEDERVLRACQNIVDENLARPILIGRPDVVQHRIDRMGLRLKIDRDLELVNPEDDPRYREYWELYYSIMERKGVSPDAARTIMRTNATAIAAIMVKRGEADAMVCGTYGQYSWHLRYLTDVIGLADGVTAASALSALIVERGIFFICDTYITHEPSAEEVAETTKLSAEQIKRFGITPKVALLSHSSFGTSDAASARRMRDARLILERQVPDLEVEGEIHADAALDEELRQRIFPHSHLQGEANLLVMPSLDAANISLNLLKTISNGLVVGPMLMGMAQAAFIATPSVTARGLMNITALAVVDAQKRGQKRVTS